MYPYLVQSGVPLSRSFGDYIGTWPVPTESAAEREDATARLWSDPVFEALLQTRYWLLAMQTSALGRKRTFDFVEFGASERPLWRKADIPEYPQDFHNIDQLGTSALPW